MSTIEGADGRTLARKVCTSDSVDLAASAERTPKDPRNVSDTQIVGNVKK